MTVGNEASVLASKVCTVCGARYPADALFCPVDGMPLVNASAAGREAEDDPYLGQEISGHIEIRQLVGIGAMGRVYRAFQKGIDRDVAVKILHRELSANSQLVSRFTREAKVASRLQHPNVVQVLLAGQLPDRALYMVMEYLDGLSLQSALAAAGGALPLPRALHVALQLCEATGEAHAQGIVHRDLKPENVMLVRRGADPDFVKVLDFGIARINWGEQSVATAAGLIFGTARYISPEGAQGNTVGPPSDVYAIATLLFQMLAGRTPFEGDQAVGLLVQQIHDQPPSLRSIPRAEYVPAPIADVIMANLVKDPKRREPDARSFGHAIVDAAKQAGLSPEDISRPMLRRQPSAMQLPPTERTKQLDLTPDVAQRMSPPPAAGQPSSVPPDARASGNGRGHDRPPMAATAKWEPSPEFQARISGALAGDPRADRSSGVLPSTPSSRPMSAAPTAPPSLPRANAVDETLDDASAEPPVVLPPVGATMTPSVPRTMPGDEEAFPPAEKRPRTDYSPYAPPPVETRSSRPPPARAGSDPSHPTQPPTTRASTPAPAPRATVATVEGASKPSRGILFVAVCFVIGALIAFGWAWNTGKLGGGADDERYVARATEAMFKNRFVAPPGDNVRDITDEGLKRWPNHHKLLDVRMRAANELTQQAMAQRSAGDIAEALRLARAAHELDPNDASAKRLVDQYEADLAAVGTPSSQPLGKPPVAPPSGKPVPAGPGPAGPPSASPASSASAYRVAVDTSTATPRLGQTVELLARVTPVKGEFESPTFTITGPGLGAGARMPAQSPSPGVFRASFAFLEAGRFEVTFTTQVDGKPLRASRPIGAGEAPARPDPPPNPTPPTPTGSVKWM
ncbi:MAG: protein kinase [Deltaproteobacteria bacterium]|nr:protein kinase [Deltaproteobacteria bacterium]